MEKVKVGGVPEYFNFPIHQAIENGTFEKVGIDVQWQNVPEGTGKMSKMLAEGALDVAIILTEGITRSIINGNPAKIIHTYVSSPLIWGIHVASKSKLESLDNLEEMTFAISRFGSGSHLMAILLAEAKGISVDHLTFEVVNNLEGARYTLPQHENMLFLWEKYTTRYLVESGEFRRIGEWPTPWPCFVMAANDDFLEKAPGMAKDLVNGVIQSVVQCQTDPNLGEKILEQYQIHSDDIGSILQETTWNTALTLPGTSLDKILKAFDEHKRAEYASWLTFDLSTL